eukprot:GILK01000334.1.p1 GENE.GILK01000334.1~~GILK01000334.1.p1  ORF type:complete len:431 (+),score=60.11 GILK01000334.1:41-1294(+)
MKAGIGTLSALLVSCLLLSSSLATKSHLRTKVVTTSAGLGNDVAAGCPCDRTVASSPCNADECLHDGSENKKCVNYVMKYCSTINRSDLCCIALENTIKQAKTLAYNPGGRPDMAIFPAIMQGELPRFKSNDASDTFEPYDQRRSTLNAQANPSDARLSSAAWPEQRRSALYASDGPVAVRQSSMGPSGNQDSSGSNSWTSSNKWNAVMQGVAANEDMRRSTLTTNTIPSSIRQLSAPLDYQGRPQQQPSDFNQRPRGSGGRGLGEVAPVDPNILHLLNGPAARPSDPRDPDGQNPFVMSPMQTTNHTNLGPIGPMAEFTPSRRKAIKHSDDEVLRCIEIFKDGDPDLTRSLQHLLLEPDDNDFNAKRAVDRPCQRVTQKRFPNDMGAVKKMLLSCLCEDPSDIPKWNFWGAPPDDA